MLFGGRTGERAPEGSSGARLAQERPAMIAPGHLDYLDQPPSNWFCPRRDAMQSAEVGLVRTEIKEQIEGVRLRFHHQSN
jgi:hypothetical protein